MNIRLIFELIDCVVALVGGSIAIPLVKTYTDNPWISGILIVAIYVFQIASVTIVGSRLFRLYKTHHAPTQNNQMSDNKESEKVLYGVILEIKTKKALISNKRVSLFTLITNKWMLKYELELLIAFLPQGEKKVFKDRIILRDTILLNGKREYEVGMFIFAKLIDNEISLLTPIENCQVPPEELSYLQNYCKDWNLPLQSTFEHPHPNVDWAHVYGQKKV